MTKPGGIVAVKDFDATILQFLPLDPAGRGSACESSRNRIARHFVWHVPGAILRRAGLTDLVRKSWLVERWAPPSPPTRQFVTLLLRLLAGYTADHDVPPADREALRAAAADPDRLLDNSDLCLRENFVVTLGRVPT